MLVYNPTAGKGKAGKLLPKVQALLGERGFENNLTLTEGVGHAQRLSEQAVEAGCDLLVVAGGDGTVNEAINGLMSPALNGRKRPALGVLHRPHPGHAALASDVQEPFRHLMDLAVIETLHRLQPRDFIDTGRDDWPLRLSARASRELLGQVHRLLATPCQAPGQSEPKPYRQQALSMIRALRTHLRDRQQPFVVFEHP